MFEFISIYECKKLAIKKKRNDDAAFLYIDVIMNYKYYDT